MAITPKPFPVPAPGATTQAESIVPSDTVDLAKPTTRGIWVGGAGDVVVAMAGQSAPAQVLFAAVPAGTLLPICVTRVFATGTSASLLRAMY